MFTHLYDESPSERFRGLTEMVRRKAPFFMRCGGLVGTGEGGRAVITQEMREQMRAWWHEGITHDEVARRLKCSPSVVSTECARAGLRRQWWPRGPRKRIPVDVPWVFAQRNLGRTMDDIAAELGTTRQLLFTRIREWRAEAQAA